MNLGRIIAVRNNKTIYREGKRCIKVFDHDYFKTDILNEALNQARVEESGLNIPGILEVTMIEGKWAIITEYIKGKTLAQLLQEDAEKKNEYLKLLVDLQILVQERSVPMLSDLTDKMQRKISQAPLDAATRQKLKARLEKMVKQSKVCHGDFDLSNILLAEDGTPYILDWAHVTRGNAAADAARTYLLFRLRGDDEGAETYLMLFCEKAKVDRTCVEEWMPIVAASQLLKGNAREREFLLSWVNVVDQN